MNNPQTHTIKKISRKGKMVILNRLLAHISHLHELLPPRRRNNIPAVLPVKKLLVRWRLIKRASPFLLTALFLPVLIVYWFIAEEESIYNNGLLCFSFVSAEVNLLFIDFALWNYYEGKKIFRIWLIELFFVFALTLFLFEIF